MRDKLPDIIQGMGVVLVAGGLGYAWLPLGLIALGAWLIFAAFGVGPKRGGSE